MNDPLQQLLWFLGNVTCGFVGDWRSGVLCTDVTPYVSHKFANISVGHIVTPINRLHPIATSLSINFFKVRIKSALIVGNPQDGTVLLEKVRNC